MKIKLREVDSPETKYMMYTTGDGIVTLHSSRLDADPSGKYVFAKIALVLGITVKHPQAWTTESWAVESARLSEWRKKTRRQWVGDYFTGGKNA